VRLDINISILEWMRLIERLLGGYQKAPQQKSSLTFTCESPTMSIQLKSPTLAPQKTFRQGLHSCYTMSYDQTSYEKYLHTSTGHLQSLHSLKRVDPLSHQRVVQ
jgi:hypothetical protein